MKNVFFQRLACKIKIFDTFFLNYLHIQNKFCTFVAKLEKETYMPTLFTLFGFHFLFYSNDHEPIHVQVIKDRHEARYQVCPEVVLLENNGLKIAELRMAESVIEENMEMIIERWNEFFKDKK